MTDMPGHEGHDHPPLPDIDPALLEKVLKEVEEAKIIDNLFLIPTGNPPRFVLAQVSTDGDITTFGYIPFDFMLDVGIGFITAVRNAVQAGVETQHEHEYERPEGEDTPLAGGLFRVI